MKMDSWVEDRSFSGPHQDKKTVAQVEPSLDIHTRINCQNRNPQES